MPGASLPPTLRHAFAEPLEPVTPFGPPRRRAVRFTLVCAGVLAVVALVWGRGYPLVPPQLVGAGWALQTATAVLVFAAAIRESMPGRLLSPMQLFTLVLAVVLVQACWVAGWFALAPLGVPSRIDLRVARVCVTREYLLGLVPLAIAAAVLRRGLIARPAIAGGLAGLAAGLAVESSWRVYCSVTNPAHTVASHMGAMALLAATGALAGSLLGRSRGDRHTESTV